MDFDSLDIDTLLDDIEKYEQRGVLRGSADSQRRAMMMAMESLEFVFDNNDDSAIVSKLKEWTGESTVKDALLAMKGKGKNRKCKRSFKELFFDINGIDIDDPYLQSRYTDGANKILREIYEECPEDYIDAGYKVSSRWGKQPKRRRA